MYLPFSNPSRKQETQIYSKRDHASITDQSTCFRWNITINAASFPDSFKSGWRILYSNWKQWMVSWACIVVDRYSDISNSSISLSWILTSFLAYWKWMHVLNGARGMGEGYSNSPMTTNLPLWQKGGGKRRKGRRSNGSEVRLVGRKNEKTGWLRRAKDPEAGKGRG